MGVGVIPEGLWESDMVAVTLQSIGTRTKVDVETGKPVEVRIFLPDSHEDSEGKYFPRNTAN